MLSDLLNRELWCTQVYACAVKCIVQTQGATSLSEPVSSPTPAHFRSGVDACSRHGSQLTPTSNIIAITSMVCVIILFLFLVLFFLSNQHSCISGFIKRTTFNSRDWVQSMGEKGKCFLTGKHVRKNKRTLSTSVSDF